MRGEENHFRPAGDNLERQPLADARPLRDGAGPFGTNQLEAGWNNLVRMALLSSFWQSAWSRECNRLH